MKKLLTTIILASAALAATAQDSVYLQHANRFKDNTVLFSTQGVDSIEVFARGARPVFRCYTTAEARGYRDYTGGSYVTSGGESTGDKIYLGNPGLILWHPTTSDLNYNNDYSVDTNRWNFARSKESEHFVVFWDRPFGDNPNAATVPSSYRVDIDNLLKKAEQFYETNITKLHMVVVGQQDTHKSQLNHYKMSIYLLYPGTHDGSTIDSWVATGSGNDNVIGTLWVTPSTCQPAGSTIAHEIGHSFQYQTYCDNILNGKANDSHSGFRYGYPNSSGGCSFWEQCAQWQSFQDYPVEAIASTNFTVWTNNCHRHFEHEWQRYASYWEQYYWTYKQGLTALGRIWNESTYPEDANQAYMRIFLGNDYDTLRAQLAEYAQRTVTLDYDVVRTYANYSSTFGYQAYKTTFYDGGDGWRQIGYEQCPQPTGFNVIPLNVPAAGTTVTLSLQGVDAGSTLPAGDAGKQVGGDGSTVATVSAYNTTAISGHEGWAIGFVALKGTTRYYSPIELVSNTAGGAASAVSGEVSFTVPEGATRLWAVVQGSPTQYYQCPWDEKEATDHQLPYKMKVTGATLK